MIFIIDKAQRIQIWLVCTPVKSTWIYRVYLQGPLRRYWDISIFIRGGSVLLWLESTSLTWHIGDNWTSFTPSCQHTCISWVTVKTPMVNRIWHGAGADVAGIICSDVNESHRSGSPELRVVTEPSHCPCLITRRSKVRPFENTTKYIIW